MLHIENTSLKVRIMPEYGAMVAGIEMDGIHLLQMDESYLGKRNARAGGIPILFPFAGKTEGDCYEMSGRRYQMPLHGFAKDACFAVGFLEKDCCMLFFESSEATKEACYPFDFRFEVVYELDGSSLVTSARVCNRSKERMPCSLGFHPYFATSKKENLELEFDMREYWDYTNDGAHGFLEKPPVLADPLNHVFWGSAPQKIKLRNPTDGYMAALTTDSSFQAATLCTVFPGACCIEPWQGLPNCAATGIGTKWIESGCSQGFCYRIDFSRLP